MMRLCVIPFAVAALMPCVALTEEAAPSGNATAGEAAFSRQCIACHVVIDPDGTRLAGRNARTGPNLYGVAGGPVGAVPDFNYGDAIVTLRGQNETWNETNFVGYVMDPTNWLRDRLDDTHARGKMAFKVRTADDAANIYAYLHALAH